MTQLDRQIRVEETACLARPVRLAHGRAAAHMLQRMVAAFLGGVGVDGRPVSALIVDQPHQNVDPVMQFVGAFQQAVEVFDVGGGHIA